MRRFRLSRSAQADLAHILETSAERWGDAARQKYEALILTAIDQVAAEPASPLTNSRNELRSGVRSFHIRHARRHAPDDVRQPVHVIYFRARPEGVIEIIRVLHERMDPFRHINPHQEPTRE